MGANNGTISLGNIRTNGAGGAGRVQLIAEKGITVGNITATSSAGEGGDVELRMAKPSASGASITNGAYGSFLGFTVQGTAGSITTGAIALGSQSSLVVKGALNANDKINIASITAPNTSEVILTTGLGITDLGNTEIFSFRGGGGGALKLVNTGNLLFQSDPGIGGSNWDLDVSTTGTLTLLVDKFNSVKATASDITVNRPGGVITECAGDATLTAITNSVLGSLNVDGKLTINAENNAGGSESNPFQTSAKDIKTEARATYIDATSTSAITVESTSRDSF